jgi:hypothetical protein
MEGMITAKCHMLRGHLWRKADQGDNVDILAAVRSLATDVISTDAPCGTDGSGVNVRE